MAGILLNSPSEIVLQALINMGLGLDPTPYAPGTTSPLPDWLVYSSNETNEPDNTITIYDTSGVIDCRTQPDGEVQEHYGIQVRVRSKDQPTGWAKANAIAIAFTEQVNQMRVVVGANSYLISMFHQTSPVIPLGREGESRRRLFTINFTTPIHANW